MPCILIWHHPISVLSEVVVLRCSLMKVVFEIKSLLLVSSCLRCQNSGNIHSIYKIIYCKSPPYFKMWPDNPIFVFLGPNRLPAGGEEGPGKLEERPCEEDQNAGVRAEAREVSALPPTAASAHPQYTQIPLLVYNNCSDSMFCALLKINSSLCEIQRRGEHGCVRFSLGNSVCFTCTTLTHSAHLKIKKKTKVSCHPCFLLFIFYAYKSNVSAGVSRSRNSVSVPERFSPESSWCDVSGQEHVLAWRLCLLSDADDSASSSVEGRDGKGGEKNSRSTWDELTLAAVFLQ